MKKYLFGTHWYWYWLIIGIPIIAACFVMSIFDDNIFCSTILKFIEDWSAFLSAAAAGILAIVAFLAIRNANLQEALRRKHDLDRESRDRKERLLDEIIEWAIDIARWRPKEIHRDLVGIRDKVKRQELIVAHIATITDTLVEMRGRNQYILRIALKVVEQLGEAANHNLIKEVHNLIGEVEQYIEFLAEWKAIITEAMAKDTVVNDDGYFEKADHSEYELEKRVKKVIDEATNLY